jgi:hypothetical protein
MFRLISIASIALSFTSTTYAAPIRVKPSGSDGNSGDSWANAKASVSAAIAAASAGDEVWAAAGTYGPIGLKDGVKVIGGFAGTETAASQSNPETNKTYISGGGTQRAVVSSGNDATAMLRGFYITGGHVVNAEYGGGIELTNSSAKIVQCVFTGNTAGFIGGAAANWGGSPTFVNCKFHGNSAGSACGAVINREFGTPSFINCLFYENESWEGGAVCNLSGAASFVNCTFAANLATIGRGGAIVDNRGEAVIRNCVLWSNDSIEAATDAVYSNAATTTAVSHSDVQGSWSGAGNINTDPMFVDPSLDDFRLCGTTQVPSPCKDTGNSGYLPADVGDLDWDGNTDEQIPYDLTGMVSRLKFNVVDMGAYERGVGPCTSQQ